MGQTIPIGAPREEGDRAMTFVERINRARKNIKYIAVDVLREYAQAQIREQVEKENLSEVTANLMLTYRHLEDASMRLGKVIQAHDGGVSVYDKETTVGPTGSANNTN